MPYINIKNKKMACLSFKQNHETKSLTLSMWGGQLLPVASTGISSYFSKFMPVLLPEKSSLEDNTEKFRFWITTAVSLL